MLFKDVLEPALAFSNSFPFPVTSFEAVEVVLESCGKRMIFVCIYRPPPSKKNKLKPSIFHEEFQALLEHYNLCNGTLTILGDINFHFDNMKSPDTRRMCNVMADFSMSQLVSQTTHIHGHILDWVIVRDSDKLVNSVHVTNRISSDHFPVVFSLDISKPERYKKSVFRRKLSTIDYISFATEASSRLSNSPVGADSLSHYNDTLKQLLDEHAPPSKRIVPDRPFAPWYGPEILEAKRARRRAERRKNKTNFTVDQNKLRK